MFDILGEICVCIMEPPVVASGEPRPEGLPVACTLRVLLHLRSCRRCPVTSVADNLYPLLPVAAAAAALSPLGAKAVPPAVHLYLAQASTRRQPTCASFRAVELFSKVSVKFRMFAVKKTKGDKANYLVDVAGRMKQSTRGRGRGVSYGREQRGDVLRETRGAAALPKVEELSKEFCDFIRRKFHDEYCEKRHTCATPTNGITDDTSRDHASASCPNGSDSCDSSSSGNASCDGGGGNGGSGSSYDSSMSDTCGCVELLHDTYATDSVVTFTVDEGTVIRGLELAVGEIGPYSVTDVVIDPPLAFSSFFRHSLAARPPPSSCIFSDLSTRSDLIGQTIVMIGLAVVRVQQNIAEDSSLEERFEESQRLGDFARACFNRSEFARALNAYITGVRCLERSQEALELLDAVELENLNLTSCRLRLNAALCEMKLGLLEQAEDMLTQCSSALSKYSNWSLPVCHDGGCLYLKCLYRLSQLARFRGDWGIANIRMERLTEEQKKIPNTEQYLKEIKLERARLKQAELLAS
eukprot:GHVS01027645.1.p1 GENE.GHVS01027645.1~~GHVS01027645.1.p1  ORF type:complete len:525 (+),score=77.87 GHVS01027645.1:620-2194(+)